MRESIGGEDMWIGMKIGPGGEKELIKVFWEIHIF